MNRFTTPLLAFIALLGVFAIGLTLNPREIPSPLLDKPAPAFVAEHLHDPDARFSPADLRGKVWLFNVWASWCVACRDEHPLLVAYAGSPGAVPVIGLNYKDKRNDGQLWLARHGNPYQLSVFDPDGRIGLDYGVYGVPETYLIDRDGSIRHKHNGPLTTEVLENTLLPLIRDLNR
jgi:cytochrome c biogenesis protein CcmG/thiol:disulfide interchange protein DsbE